MPIHDWTRVRANRFHAFHQGWTVAIQNALNAGGLPPGYFAMVEQRASGPEPDVVTLAMPVRPGEGLTGSSLARTAAPKTRFLARSDAAAYARKANRVNVRHPDGQVVAVIEIVSPGNKSSRNAVREFARKALAFLRAGVHLLIVDLFPPGPRDPQGIHKVIWDLFQEEPFELPADKPLTLAAYSAGTEMVAYVEPVAVGDVLPEMPIFLTAEEWVPCPLEATYLSAWNGFPSVLKGPLLG